MSTTLAEIVDSLETLDEEHCIFARKPWSTDTLATVGSLTDFRVPAEVADEGFEYFLEVHVATEVLEVFGVRQPTLQERRNLIFYYAENDAYPDWVITVFTYPDSSKPIYFNNVRLVAIADTPEEQEKWHLKIVIV